MFQYYYTLLNSKDRQVYDDICRAFQKRFLVEIWLDNQLICAEVYLIPHLRANVSFAAKVRFFHPFW